MLDINGDMHDVTMNSLICDIAVYPVTDTLYCVLFNSVWTVDRVTRHRTEMFVPEGTVSALAFTNDGNMLLCDYHKPLVTVYSAECKNIQTFSYRGRAPTHIAVCRSSGRIAVTCVLSDLLVLDRYFTELYRYESSIYFANQYISMRFPAE